MRGILKAETSSSDDSQPGDANGGSSESTCLCDDRMHAEDQVSCRVELRSEDGVTKTHVVKLPTGSTAAALQDRVAELFTRCRSAFVDSSRITLLRDDESFADLRGLIVRDGDSFEAKLDVVKEDWRALVDRLPDRLAKCLLDLSLLSSSAKTWGDDSDFHLLVQGIHSLCKREQRRGGAGDLEEEVDEVYEVLQEAVAVSNPSPSGVLALLREEFGI